MLGLEGFIWSVCSQKWVISFRYKGRSYGYQALDIEEGIKEGCSLCKPMDNDNNDDESVSKIKDGFADVFSQFQSIGDISQVSIDFEWNTFIVARFSDLLI